MSTGRSLMLGASALTIFLSHSCVRVRAQRSPRTPIVRLAELEIDPAQLDRYRAALREEVETSIRVEPGVLTLYSVSINDDPSRIRLFEMYADSNAYNAHIASSHFQKYKTGTQAMVKSLNLIETTPLLLATKRTEFLGSFVTAK